MQDLAKGFCDGTEREQRKGEQLNIETTIDDATYELFFKKSKTMQPCNGCIAKDDYHLCCVLGGLKDGCMKVGNEDKVWAEKKLAQ